MANKTGIPSPEVPFVDPKTGLVNREWYRFLSKVVPADVGGTFAGPVTVAGTFTAQAMNNFFGPQGAFIAADGSGNMGFRCAVGEQNFSQDTAGTLVPFNASLINLGLLGTAFVTADGSGNIGLRCKIGQQNFSQDTAGTLVNFNTKSIQTATYGPWKIAYGLQSGNAAGGTVTFAAGTFSSPPFVMTAVNTAFTTQYVITTLIHTVLAASFTWTQTYVPTAGGAGGSGSESFYWLAIGN